jgi:hypothetical protein
MGILFLVGYTSSVSTKLVEFCGTKSAHGPLDGFGDLMTNNLGTNNICEVL